MDFDLKLKALVRLTESTTPDAQAALKAEVEKAISALSRTTQYEELEQALAVIEIVGHQHSATVVQALISFIQSLAPTTTSPTTSQVISQGQVRVVQGSQWLIVKAIEILIHLRYWEITPILSALLSLSIHDSAEIRRNAFDGLERLASYNIDVIFGNDRQRGIGVVPQQEIVTKISSLDDDALRKHFSAIVQLADCLLSSQMETTSWTYKTMTLSRGQLPGVPAIAEIRDRAIQILKHLYALGETGQKIGVVESLLQATRLPPFGETREDALKMVAEDTIDVLAFFAGLITWEKFDIVQKLEHRSYWLFFHAMSAEVADAARTVESAIAENSEYEIYKTLIGFEGVFGDWQVLKQSEKSDKHFGEIEKYRKDRALEFARQINLDNFPLWRQRILKFAETESNDLATFPIFYYFLEQVATLHPALALTLLRSNASEMERFLIPVMRALTAGPERVSLNLLIDAWVEEGRFLYACIKQFLSSEHLDADLLTRLLNRAADLDDLHAISMVMSVAVSNFTPGKRFLVERFFLPALAVLTRHSNTNWILDFWFRRETRALFRELTPEEVDQVLENLASLTKIDYHAEEILYLLAERLPERVIDFFCERLARTNESSSDRLRLFEAVPFEFHKLNQPLAEVPQHAVRRVRATYDGNYGIFIHRGARLLHIIFPNFPKEFEDQLRVVLRSGENSSIEFVLAILRNYKGEPAIHDICKEIIRILPADSSLRKEIAIVLEATGVVTGEFGFVEAYERKKEEIRGWLNDPDEKVQNFTRWYIDMLEKMTAAERKRAEEDIALRKHKYGE